MAKIIIVCAIIFAYLLIGYVIGTVILAIGLSDYEVDVYITCIVWPILIPMLAIWLLLCIVTTIGNKIAVIPVSIALAIKYIVEKKHEEEGEE